MNREQEKEQKLEERELQEKLETLEERSEEDEQERLARENKMGVMPVGPLLLNMSLPIMISMLVQALYNVVDSIFVARLGEGALAAVGFVFPIQNLMIAVGVGTAVGVNSRLSRRLGEQNVDSANRVAQNGVFLSVLNTLLFALIGIFGSRAFLDSMTGGSAVSAEVVQMGVEYMQIVTIASLGVFMSITMERLLQATGRTMYSMVSQLAGALTNIILDPIMIFGLLGFPALGVAGAAWATVIGQFVGMFIGIWANVAKNPDIRVHFRHFRPNLKTIKHIYQVGLPSIVMQSIGSVMTYFMNIILVGFGTTAVSVFSVYFKLQSFIFMPVFGLTNGMIPIIAFNYGAKKPERIKKTMQLGMLSAVCIMVVGTLLFLVIPGPLLSLFNAGEEMLTMGKAALRIIGLCFPFAAVSIIFGSMFQAMGQGLYSLIVSVVRQLVVLLPLAWLLAKWQGLPALWFAFPAAELVCIVVSVWFFSIVWRQKVVPLRRS